MNITELNKNETLTINGGTAPNQSSFNAGAQVGDYLAGMANGLLTVFGLKGMFK